MLEAVTVRHYTSRAGDPHRHLHLQIGARVFATEQWRGLHTVGMRDFFAAINGIGRSLDRYERDWMAAHPDEQPGPALRRAWDGRAWAEGRPDKVIPRSGADLVARWRAELGSLGYRDPAHPVSLAPTPIGALDREAAVDTVLTRLAAGRSAWNAADVRGEAERVIAAKGIVADPAVRLELAEDLTARALLTVADRAGARLALLGDRHQLPAVGRGGVLDLVAAQVDPAACLTLESVHRFTRTDSTGQSVPYGEHAELTLAMRQG
jgi:hypothetical protein